MSKKISIELIEEGKQANIYSVHYDGEEYDEFKKLLKKLLVDGKTKEIGIILARLDKVKELGAADRYFLYESLKKDRVFALPSYIDNIDVRIYCLVIDGKIVILGGGGIKNVQKYQEDPVLNGWVETMKKVDAQIRHLQKTGAIQTKGKELKGTLKFSIKE